MMPFMGALLAAIRAGCAKNRAPGELFPLWAARLAPPTWRNPPEFAGPHWTGRAQVLSSAEIEGQDDDPTRRLGRHRQS